MNNIKIGTFNVRGLANHSKRRKIFHFLNQREFDVVFLQETHSTKKYEKYWRSSWGAEYIIHMEIIMLVEHQF